MVPKTVVAAALVAALGSTGCQSFKEARPPSHPLPVWATWTQVEQAKFTDYYSKTVVDNLNGELAAAQTAAMAASATGCGRQPALRGNAAPANAPSATCPAYARYQSVGLMLSEVHCNVYLAAMDRAGRHQHFARNATSDLGTGVNAVMALFKTAVPVSGVVTTSFGVLENGFKNYDTAYLPEEDVRNARGIFQRARQELLANYEANPPESLAMAEFRINYYASSCSIDWMRRLIDASVGQSNNDGDARDLINLMGGAHEAGAR